MRFSSETLLRMGEGYTEYVEYKAAREAERLGGVVLSQTTTLSAGKEDYLRAKKEQSDSRREQKRLERMKKEAEKLEAELQAISEELFGSAATDYVRAAELEAMREEKEERLLEIYEEIGV